VAGDRRLEGGLGWPEIQEARDDRLRQSASNGVEAQAAEWLKAQREAPDEGAQAESQRTSRDTNRRTRVPQGDPSGGASPRFWVAERHPRPVAPCGYQVREETACAPSPTPTHSNNQGWEKGTYPLTKLTVDQAVAEFLLVAREELAALPTVEASSGDGAEPTPRDSEELYFRCAEEVLRIACPDAGLCADRRCRRGGVCRHLVDLEAWRQGRRPVPKGRRPPGVLALRHAIWVCLNGDT
jgi:hypothetical protein